MRAVSCGRCVDWIPDVPRSGTQPAWHHGPMSRSTFTPHTVHVNDTELAYTDEGRGEPVVLLHGHAYDRSMWEGQVTTLTEQGWRVIAPDLRGFGAVSYTHLTLPTKA